MIIKIVFHVSKNRAFLLSYFIFNTNSTFNKVKFFLFLILNQNLLSVQGNFIETCVLCLETLLTLKHFRYFMYRKD